MVDVTMPQLGETVTEGTITAWLKAPGDWVDEDEPLLEVSTEKVDSEIPAPGSGHVGALLVAEGETVPVGTVLTHLDPDLDASDVADDDADLPATAAVPTPPVDDAQGSSRPAPASEPAAVPTRPEREVDGAFLSPAVRRLTAEHGVDVGSIEGSGRGGRVTANDVERALAARSDRRPTSTPTSGPATAPSLDDPEAAVEPLDGNGPSRADAPPGAPVTPSPGTEIVPFTAIRRTTAANLTRSLATAAHTLVVMEVDYLRVDAVRADAGLSYLPFISRAVIDALAEYPHLNAHVGDDHLVVHESVHLGVAVDLDFEGLVVPVVRDADRLRLRSLADALSSQAAAARAGELTVDDLTGGTFTLTNAGRYGTLFTAPIINRPQAAILATDGVRVRPVAVPTDAGEHALGFHPVGNLALSFDHRAVDGAYASAFLDRVRTLLESRDWSDELGSRP